MRKILLFICLFMLVGTSASAAPTGLSAQPAAQPAAQSPTQPPTQLIDEMGDFPTENSGNANMPPETSYINPVSPKLDSKEKHALALSNQYAERQIQPVLSNGGKVVFMHGATMPTVIASPMQICDVELQAGEVVNEVIIGDSSRWMIETGSSGSAQGEVTHLLIKPVDAGIETSAVVTTDRRTYHLKLVSQRKGHTPYVGFSYMDDVQRQLAAQRKAKAKEDEWNSGDFDGQNIDLTNLNFNYEVKGDRVAWMPERVYDDGQQTFIRLPEKSVTGEMPVLLVRKGKKDVLVNYRTKGSTMVVDGLFDIIALIVGVGGDQEKVEVRRDK